MFPILHAYKLRLTNLSQGNRSLKLGMLSPRKDLDLTMASFVNKLSAEEILNRILSGKSVELIKALNPRDEATNLLDKRLNKVFREVSTLHQEAGTYDLFLGYPFVEGKFLDGSIARCPVVLIPVRLERDFQSGSRWRISIPENEPITLNKTFFLALEKFMQIRLPKEFWEEEMDHQEDIQAFLNQLYAFFQRFDLPLNFTSNLFQFKLLPFEEKNAAMLDLLQVGQLKFHPFAVMGLFPQSDSSLLQDYEALERNPEQFSLESILSPQPLPPPSKPPKEDERYFITPVDQSQEEALLKVRAGQSVVVHGPPGTGKSQVILNLIADALAQGQRVLVCSQKRAALDVVYQRLADLGLGNFAALVHDFRGDRSRIFQHIAKQISALEESRQAASDVTMDKWLRDFRLDARRLDELNQYFDDLHSALTTVSRFGLSPHQLYLMADPGKSAPISSEVAAKHDYVSLRATMERIRSLEGYLDLYNPVHSWLSRHSMHAMDQRARDVLIANMDALPKQMSELHAAWLLVSGWGVSFRDIDGLRKVLDPWHSMAKCFDGQGVINQYNLFKRDALHFPRADFIVRTLSEIAGKMVGFQLLDGFPLRMFEDLKERYEAYRAGEKKTFRFFSLDWQKGRWYLARIVKHRGKKWGPDQLGILQKEYDVLAKFYELFKETTDLGFYEDLPTDGDPEQIRTWCERKQKALAAVDSLRFYTPPEGMSPLNEQGRFDLDCWMQAQALAESGEKYIRLYSSLVSQWKSWLHKNQIEALLRPRKNGPDPQTSEIQFLKEQFVRDFERMRELDLYLQTWDALSLDLHENLRFSFCKPKDSNPFGSFEEWEAAPYRTPVEIFQRLCSGVEHTVYRDWIEILEREKPILAETTSPRMRDMRQSYLDKVKERQESAVELIRARLQRRIVEEEEVNRLGNPVTYREIARQVQKQRRLWTLRKLIQECWGQGLDTLVPCWMASPESVAAIFPMQAGYFDLVIFDEASQCYVERALPVILRGKTVVVAGDDKQLQPFDLYSVKIEDSEDAFLENEMAMEVESVLDLGKNIYPEVLLRWHYRSREEALIRFSNEAFYDGRLMVMPPAYPDPGSQPPLEFMEIQGRWENNRNETEARAVVDLVETIIRRDDSLSIGIVTFNFPQMELIQDLIDQRLESLDLAFDVELKSKWQKVIARGAGENSQGLFVKNIENVQGDERDVIIFSVGYAPNASGKLVTQFGLLNQRGGENRLNVAVTRARRKIYLLCSFDPDRLMVEETLHQGPKLFKKYLQYARSVSSNAGPVSDNGGTQSGSGVIAQKLAVMLRDKGLKVVESLGGTAYKVDLAVMGQGGRFRLGIECEGSVYFSGRSAKEREVYRRRLLESGGWRLHRVWARAFHLDPNAVVAEIMSLLEQDAQS